MAAAFSALFEKIKLLYREETPESLVHCDPVWTWQDCACENEISLLVSADGTVLEVTFVWFAMQLEFQVWI